MCIVHALVMVALNNHGLALGRQGTARQIPAPLPSSLVQLLCYLHILRRWVDTCGITIMTSQTLPTEVCERIIDFVADRGEGADELWLARVFATLQACSLTCRAWVSRTRFHLFRIVGVGGHEKSLATFALFMDENPALHDFVDTFVMHGDSESPVTELHLLPLKIPQLIPKTRSIYIDGGILYPPSPFFASMRRFVNIEQLTLFGVAFHSLHDLRRTICAFKNLKELVLSYLKWLPGQTSPPHPPSADGKSHLSCLAIDGNEDWLSDSRSNLFLEWILRTKMISTLDSLYLVHCRVATDRLLEAVHDALQSCRESLMFLSVALENAIPIARCKSYLEAFLDDANMSFQVSNALTKLDSLVLLSIKLPRSTESFEDLVDTFYTYSLSGNSDTPRLRNLAVILDDRPGLKLETEAQWAKLDTVLQGPRFKSLIRVTTKCVKAAIRDGKSLVDNDGNDTLASFGSEEAEEWRGKLKQCLPLTAKRHILVYEPGSNMAPHLV